MVDKPNQESIEYRKVQAGVGDHSLSFVFPKKYAIDLGLEKGDYVKVMQKDGMILIQKA